MAGEGYAEIDFFVVQAKTTAAGDHNGAVVERIVGLGDTLIRSGRRCVQLSRALHGERFMRAFAVELVNELVEFSLLLQDVGAGRAGGFLFQS